jgi:DNA-binding response OmpR family regulator
MLLSCTLKVSDMQKEMVKVVVVDDVDDAAQALATLLRLEGCDVATATTSEQAIVLIEDFQPHAVMLDVNMPGIDGYELACLLRHRYKDQIVLIAITGGSLEEARVANTFAIVDHYFQKPVDTKRLGALLSGPTSAG